VLGHPYSFQLALSILRAYPFAGAFEDAFRASLIRTSTWSLRLFPRLFHNVKLSSLIYPSASPILPSVHIIHQVPKTWKQRHPCSPRSRIVICSHSVCLPPHYLRFSYVLGVTYRHVACRLLMIDVDVGIRTWLNRGETHTPDSSRHM
jgi:hypothetical protein